MLFVIHAHRVPSPHTRHTRTSAPAHTLVIPAQAGIHCPAGTSKTLSHTHFLLSSFPPIDPRIHSRHTRTLRPAYTLVIPAQAGIHCPAGTYFCEIFTPHKNYIFSALCHRCNFSHPHSHIHHTRTGGYPLPRRDSKKSI